MKTTKSKINNTKSRHKIQKIISPIFNDNKITAIPKRKTNIKDPYIPAKYVFLLDEENSYPLYQKNAHKSVPIASITKIMTSIIILDDYDIDKTVTVDKESAYVTGSKMHLVPNEQISIENLLWGLLMVSGNDASHVLAKVDSKDGKMDKFVANMNEKAKLLGLNNSFFLDPAGLDDNGHSSAHDLAYLTSYALRHPLFNKIISTAEKTVTSSNGKISHKLRNTNRLVLKEEPFYLPYSLGGKTGYTELAGHCLITAAKQNDHTLVSVVLNTNSTLKSESARLNRKLITWGYNNYIWPNN